MSRINARLTPCLALLGALAACGSPPPPEAFDKHPVGATSTAIAAKRAEQTALAEYVEPAPLFAYTSDEMARAGLPVPPELAATRAMALVRDEPGVAMKVGGEVLGVVQVGYDGQPFLVGRVQGGVSRADLSEAFKALAPTMTLCRATGPVWRAGASYAAALSCS